MGVARRWVFPIAWIIIFAAIAAALVKIAFLPDPIAAADPAVPGAEIVDPQYAVTLGTVRNDVTLSGSIASDAAVPIPATLSGEVREVYVSAGQAIKAGQDILLLRAQVAYSDGTSGTEWDRVTAPAAGTLSSFTALLGQQYSVGDPVGQIAPPGFHVSGSIPPEQLYRLTQRPTEALVTITGGPAPFTCTRLTITTPLAGQSGGTGGETPSGPVVSCAVPGDVTVFPGLTAEIVIAGGIAEDVLVVPITAVEGAAGVGNVYFVLPDGTTEVREVTLGLTDGVNIEITEGLVEGDLILQFVPGAPSLTPEDNCFPDGRGGMVCQG